MYTRRAEECTGEGGRARHTRMWRSGLMHEWKESGKRNDGRAAHAIFYSKRNMMGVINSMAAFQRKEQERERERERERGREREMKIDV
jgi:hypothetical protein